MSPLRSNCIRLGHKRRSHDGMVSSYRQEERPELCSLCLAMSCLPLFYDTVKRYSPYAEQRLLSYLALLSLQNCELNKPLFFIDYPVLGILLYQYKKRLKYSSYSKWFSAQSGLHYFCSEYRIFNHSLSGNFSSCPLQAQVITI